MYILLILLIFLLAASAIILVPFHVCIDLKIEGFSFAGFYVVKWFGFTLGRVELSGPNRSENRNKPEDKKKLGDGKESEEKKVGKNDNADKRWKLNSIRFLKDPRIFIYTLPSIFRVLKDLTRCIHIERMFLNITLGLDDPANTAVLCGYLWSIASSASIPSTILIDPYFAGERLDGTLYAEIWGRILWVLVALVSALRERQIRRLLKELSWKGFRGLGNKPQMRWLLWGTKVRNYGNNV
jgi:hypothetical protein